MTISLLACANFSRFQRYAVFPLFWLKVPRAILAGVALAANFADPCI
jgi:hypothetical protein